MKFDILHGQCFVFCVQCCREGHEDHSDSAQDVLEVDIRG